MKDRRSDNLRRTADRLTKPQVAELVRVYAKRARYRSKITPLAEMLSLTLMKVLLMTCFYALVHKDADSSFGVTFPDLPGCYSAADRIEDVLPNAAEALELWFEDQEDVTPSLLYEVQRFVAEELASGAFIVAVPRVARLPETR